MMQPGDKAREEGFVLAAAVLAIVVVGALVVAGFFASAQEDRIGTASRYSTEAFLAAERGLNDAVGQLTRTQLDPLALDSSGVLLTATYRSGGATVSYTVRLRHVVTGTYLIESTGKVVAPVALAGATRRVGMVARTLLGGGLKRSAIQTFGPLAIGGNATINGNDAIPPAWLTTATDCPGLNGVPGVLAKDSTEVTTFGSGAILGVPNPTKQDTALTEADFLSIGPLEWADLISLANKTYSGNTTVRPAPSLVSGGACNINDNDNWGAPTTPTHPCHTHFPIIYATGDMRITGGEGQGVLLVEGDLQWTGQFQFYGIVLVRGNFARPGTGTSNLFGLLKLFTDGDLNQSSTMAGTHITQYSSCTIERMLRNISALNGLFPITEGSWMDMSDAGAASF